MNCLKCGTPFSEDEVFMIKEEEVEPICDGCDLSGEIYLITYNGEEFAVQAQNQEAAVEKWKNYVHWVAPFLFVTLPSISALHKSKRYLSSR